MFRVEASARDFCVASALSANSWDATGANSVLYSGGRGKSSARTK